MIEEIKARWRFFKLIREPLGHLTILLLPISYILFLSALFLYFGIDQTRTELVVTAVSCVVAIDILCIGALIAKRRTIITKFDDIKHYISFISLHKINRFSTTLDMRKMSEERLNELILSAKNYCTNCKSAQVIVNDGLSLMLNFKNHADAVGWVLQSDSNLIDLENPTATLS